MDVNHVYNPKKALFMQKAENRVKCNMKSLEKTFGLECQLFFYESGYSSFLSLSSMIYFFYQ